MRCICNSLYKTFDSCDVKIAKIFFIFLFFIFWRKRLPKYDIRGCHYSLVFAKVFTKNICGVFVILYIKHLIPVMS